MRILYVGPEDVSGDADVGFLERVENLDVCVGLTGCQEKLAELESNGTPPGVVVVGRGVEHPLSVARTARSIFPVVGLAIVASGGSVESMQQKLALSPLISDTAVIAATDEDLPDAIRQLAEDTRRRHRTQGALDDINLELHQRELDRRMARPQQSVSDQHLSALTRHAPDAIVSVDVTGSVASWNEAATTIFGYEADRTEGADLGDLLSPKGERDLDRVIQAAARGSAQKPTDMHLRREDGSEFTASVTAAPVRDHRDGVVGAVLIMRDVTEQRRTEEQLRHLQKAQSMATLAGGVAHDFNNLLVSVQGWAELALDDPDDADLVEQALQQIAASAGQAARLARQMLAYSGRADLTLRSLDVNEVVTDMTNLLRSSISRKIELETDLHRALPRVEADATQLRQVVLNLVTNAAEAIGDDAGRIEVRTGVRDLGEDPLPDRGPHALPARTHVVLSVSDTGKGMDRATAERAFEPFFTTKFTGRGLGLAAAMGIAQAHGGTIHVKSAPGVGTEFQVLLPAETTS